MTNKQPTLKIGVMGAATIARRSVIPAILNSPHFELHAIASRTADKANEFATEFGCKAVVGYDALLDEPLDALYMPLPTGLHEEWVLKTIARGIPILVEKSLAMSLNSAQKMVEAARKKRLVLMENFMFPHHQQNQKVKQLIDDGTIGEIVLLRSSFGFPPLPADNFRYNASVGGGALLDAGAYTLKVAQFFFGTGNTVLSSVLSFQNDVDLGGCAMLFSAQGVSTQAAWGFNRHYQCLYELWGSNGRIVVDRAYTAKPDYAPHVYIETGNSQKTIRLKPFDHFTALLNEFYRAIHEHDYQPQLDIVLDQARMVEEVRTKAVIHRQ